MALSFPRKEAYTTQDLRELVRLLRSPEGCPWDRAQTHESIRSSFLEETHEAIEAINEKDMLHLREELGDVLLQIMLHAEMAQEEQAFTYDDVVTALCQKLLVRHPHVFGDVKAGNEAEALSSWDAVKRASEGGRKQSDLLKNVPRSLPALMRAEKVQGRAKRVGFDWPSVDGALTALDSEVAELKEALASGDAAAIEEELGDLLFSAVNVSRFTEADAEQALTVATDKFIRRFTEVERLAEERGLPMPGTPLETLDALWAEAKRTDPA